MIRRTAILLSILSLTSCASYNAQFNQLHGGSVRPVAYVHTKDQSKVINKITEFCDRNNYDIDTSTSNSVTCSTTAPVMAQAFLGSKYGTTVRQQFKYMVIPLNDKIKITARVSLGNQTAFGQNKSMDIQNNDVNSGLQRTLDIIKSEVEQGK